MQKIAEELIRLEENGQLRNIPNIISKSDCKIIVDWKEYINLASNDYLGISTKTELREDFLKESSSLMSSASARLLTGTSQEYNKLEKTVAKIFKKESALLFNTGYQANLGVISALISKGDVVFSDKLNHASIIDGMKLSGGDFYRFKHCDYENLEKILKDKRHLYKRAIIVTESLFSMDGDISDIEKLAKLKEKYNCILMTDEAHAFCAYGKSLAGLTEGNGPDIITATFGKAVGSFGAFCVSSEDIIKYLVNKSRSFIFSTSLPPITVSWSEWILNNKREFVISQKQKLGQITNYTHKKLKNLGIKTPSVSHIIPIIIGDNEQSEKLRAEGFYIPAIRPPTVPNGTSRLRISLSADCTTDMIDNLFGILYK